MYFFYWKQQRIKTQHFNSWVLPTSSQSQCHVASLSTPWRISCNILFERSCGWISEGSGWELKPSPHSTCQAKDPEATRYSSLTHIKTLYELPAVAALMLVPHIEAKKPRQRLSTHCTGPQQKVRGRRSILQQTCLFPASFWSLIHYLDNGTAGEGRSSRRKTKFLGSVSSLRVSA